MPTARGMRFADIAILDDQAIDLATAALLIATDEYPGLDVQHYLDELDQMASRAGQAASGLVEPADILLAINSICSRGMGTAATARTITIPETATSTR